MTRALTSASNLFRRYLCPGSAQMETGLPEENSEEAREGTLLHDYKAHSEYVRSTIAAKYRDLLEIADQLEKTLIERVQSQFQLTDREPFIQGREMAVEMLGTGLTGHPDFSRHYHKKRLIVVNDFKFGYAVVERAELNLQLRAYGVMAIDSIDNDTENVVVAISQPRAPYSERLTIANYTHEDIAAAREQIIQILKRAEQPDAPLNPGAEQCRYCKARTICPALKDAIQTGLVVPFRGYGLVSQDLSETAKLSRIEALLASTSDDKLEAMLEAFPLVRLIYEPTMDEARRRIEAGQLTNYILAKGKKSREITEPKKAKSLLQLRGLFTKTEIDDLSPPPSLRALEEKLREKDGKKTWKEIKELVENTLKGLINVEQSKPRVTRK